MHKKGQVTLFILLGFILLIIIILALLFKTEIASTLQISTLTSESVLPEEVQEVKDLILSCLLHLEEENVYLLGLNGGDLYQKIPNYLVYGTLTIPYLYDQGQNNMLELNEWEQNLENSFNLNYQNCMLEFTDYKLDYGESEVDVKIESNYIEWNIYWPIMITKNDITYTVYDFVNEQEIRLGSLYEIINLIIENQIYNNEFCLSCLSDIGIQNNIEINIENQNEGTLFLVKDKLSQLYEQDYQFIFATRY